MINGTGSVSLRKKDLENQKIPTVGFQKTVFAHKATNGATGINLAALTTPTELTSLGFSQPSVGELQNANLLFYRNNLKLVSSLRGQLVDFLSYTVSGSTQITFQGFTAAAGEIFVGTIDYNAVTGVKVVDATPTIATGTLTALTRDFNSGTPFKVGTYPTTQVGSVLVYLDGMQQFRNTGNSSTVLDGNYYEVDAGGGLGVIIRFNQADTVARSVLVVSNGLVSERPDGSMMATIEGVQGQINNLATYVAAAVGQPLTTVLGGAPSNVDLKAFGDRVLTLEQNRARIDLSNTWTASQALPVGSTVNGVRVDRKQYLAGTAYTNGTITVTSSQAGFVNSRSTFVPYQTSDGAWRLSFNVAGSFTSATITGVNVNISGVTFKNASNYNQSVNALFFGSPDVGVKGFASPNTTTLVLAVPSTAGQTGLGVSGDVELDSKPTWAD